MNACTLWSKYYILTRISQTLDDLGDGRPLLPDGDVDAVQLLLLVGAVVEPLLVDDGVDGDGGLAGLTIADDELALPASDRHQRVDGLDAALHRLAHGDARDDAWSLDANTGPLMEEKQRRIFN